MVHRGKSQVYGHLNVLENESNRGGRHVTVAVVSRESTLLSRVDTLGISGVRS